ncbi:MAG TPA: adenine phosphoribosyltransferase [Gemmatimonas sp.]|uniref:adenine phosphoribosyltransferase n=1 Tax=Gemmatimonas sp. TaxID=1962908 RepID=UPI002ED81023
MTLQQRLEKTIRDVPDFPSPGILFKDITPVLADPALFADVIAALADPFRGRAITHVVGIESRGFLFGVPVAMALGVPFAPARKPGKLPWRSEQEAYSLEYRQDVLEMHVDALVEAANTQQAGGVKRVLVVDDVLATGGTAAAASRLVERLGGEVTAIAVAIELGFLGGRVALGDRPVHSVLAY